MGNFIALFSNGVTHYPPAMGQRDREKRLGNTDPVLMLQWALGRASPAHSRNSFFCFLFPWRVINQPIEVAGSSA